MVDRHGWDVDERVSLLEALGVRRIFYQIVKVAYVGIDRFFN
jgi:hypothetical protein